MIRYLLDTNICSYALKQISKPVQHRLEQTPLEAICISVITKAELLYGLAASPGSARYRMQVEKFLQYVQVIELAAGVADHYAEIRATLKRTGQMIGANDLFLAAHARSLDLVLVTNNVREYSRVPGLRIENWAEPA